MPRQKCQAHTDNSSGHAAVLGWWQWPWVSAAFSFGEKSNCLGLGWVGQRYIPQDFSWDWKSNLACWRTSTITLARRGRTLTLPWPWFSGQWSYWWRLLWVDSWASLLFSQLTEPWEWCHTVFPWTIFHSKISWRHSWSAYKHLAEENCITFPEVCCLNVSFGHSQCMEFKSLQREREKIYMGTFW